MVDAKILVRFDLKNDSQSECVSVSEVRMSSLSGDAHSPLLCGTQVLDLTSHVGYLIFQTLWWEDMR